MLAKTGKKIEFEITGDDLRACVEGRVVDVLKEKAGALFHGEFGLTIPDDFQGPKLKSSIIKLLEHFGIKIPEPVLKMLNCQLPFEVPFKIAIPGC